MTIEPKHCIRCGAKATTVDNAGNWFCQGCFNKELGTGVPIMNIQNTENTELETLKSELSELSDVVERIRGAFNQLIEIINTQILIDNPDYGDQLQPV